MMKSDEGLQYSAREEVPKPEPASHTTLVRLGRNEVRIGKDLPQDLKSVLEQLLRENENLFTNELGELNGVSRALAEHKLAVAPSARPVRQKLRPLRAEKKDVAETEVEKLLRVGFICPVRYPACLSNVVMVRKADAGWRMYVDFRNLNKACPKYSYLLPSVDRLMNQSSRCELLSFMEAHSGDNQVAMAREDEEKTSFITEMGTFCFKVMSFGLRNTGATFQRLMDKVFGTLIGRNAEVYVDDILVRSKETRTPLADLEETLANVRKAGLKLKTKKCVFGVKEGHFLGFRITPGGSSQERKKLKPSWP